MTVSALAGLPAPGRGPRRWGEGGSQVEVWGSLERRELACQVKALVALFLGPRHPTPTLSMDLKPVLMGKEEGSAHHGLPARLWVLSAPRLLGTRPEPCRVPAMRWGTPRSPGGGQAGPRTASWDQPGLV